MPFSEWGSGYRVVKKRRAYPAKSSRTSGAYFSSKGSGIGWLYCGLTRTRCDTRSGCSAAYLISSMLLQEYPTSAKGGRADASSTALRSPYRVSKS